MREYFIEDLRIMIQNYLHKAISVNLPNQCERVRPLADLCAIDCELSGTTP